MEKFTQEDIDGIFKNISSLHRFGQHTTLRRALSYFEPFISDDLRSALRCTYEGSPAHGDDCGYSTENPWDDGICKFVPNIHERQAERYRRSESSSDISSLIEMFIDFKTGRVGSLEIESASDDLITEADKRSDDYIKRFYGVVQTAPGASDELIVECMLSAVRDILNRTAVRQLRIVPFESVQTQLLISRGCVYQNTEYGEKKWADNGKKLQQYVRDVYRCEDVDLCCDNHVYTKYGDWTLRDIWVDAGNYSDKPPLPPPDFVKYPWNNACAVLDNPTGIEVTSDFGWRNIKGEIKFHAGIDIGVPAGVIIKSDVAGTIVWINSTGASGETGVIVQSPGNVFNKFWHIEPNNSLQIGGSVSVGDALGSVSAATPAIHLHRAKNIIPSGNWQDQKPENAVEPCPNMVP